jgi:type IX secretion system PorP/SprF family membrane protein
MKRLYIFLLFVFIFLQGGMEGFAQQVGMYNHYFFKPMIYNPAFAGQDDGIQAMMLSRSQWVGFKNGPQSNLFTLDGGIKDKKAGLGLTLISERRGINQRTGGNVAYSYRANLSDDMYLLFGVSVGIVNQTIDFAKAIAENNNDPTLFSGAQQKTTVDGNAGLAFNWKGLNVGFSTPQILGNRINYVDDSTTRTFYTQVRHYMASIKYKFYLSEEKGLSITPLVLVRIVPNTPLQYDGNISFNLQDKFWIGATYKSAYAIAINAGVCIHKKLYVGYSYDVITGNIGKYSGISHEIMVNFKFGTKKKQEVAPDTTKIEETEPKAAENKVNDKRVDSLAQQLAESNEKIRKLNEKLEQQSKIQEQTLEQMQAIQNNVNKSTGTQNNNQQGTDQAANQNTGNQNNSNLNSTAIEKNTNKVKEGNVWIVSNPSVDYTNRNNLHPSTGFYIIVGTFFYRDFAIAETQRFVNRGFTGSNWFYSESRQFNYIFTNKVDTKNEAILKAKEVQEKGVNDAWVLELK